MKNARQIIDDIDDYCMDDGQVAYVSGDGSWYVSNDGCQPSNTFPVSYVDLNRMSPDELAEYLEEFLTRE